MGKSIQKPLATNEEHVELGVVPRRALPAMKPVARSEVGHSHEAVHERLARNYQCNSESASKSCTEADRSMEIARNMDDHGVKKGRPLHERFNGLLQAVV
jgi:hypothetical protein